MGLTGQTRDALTDAGLDVDAVTAVIDRALAEDLRDGPDITTESTVPADQLSVANVVPRVPGVFAGGPVAMAVFETVAFTAEFEQVVPEGGALEPGRPALVIAGRTAGILTAERTALNLLTHLSGIATGTRAWVDAVAGTDARIRDTRKTLPGLRLLEKYAVRCGGGVNHRLSLGDAALIKDNHVAAAGSVRAAVEAVRARNATIPLEVEVDTLEQLDEAIAAGAELVLLDNFSTADTARAVAVAGAAGRRVMLEASGGLTLDRAREVAATGVDFLAVGALTHSAAALDLGLDLSAQPLP
jgi:nicotinate-nucleotide pyrophosphorylase (carboxylating)